MSMGIIQSGFCHNTRITVIVRPIVVEWHQTRWTLLSLVQIMAYYLSASHYMNQCWAVTRLISRTKRQWDSKIKMYNFLFKKPISIRLLQNGSHIFKYQCVAGGIILSSCIKTRTSPFGKCRDRIKMNIFTYQSSARRRFNGKIQWMELPVDFFINGS